MQVKPKSSAIFSSVYDGLPLLNDAHYKVLGLVLLRVTFLLFASLPLILSLLDAVAGTTANILYFSGVALLAFPILCDFLRRLVRFVPSGDSFLVLMITVLLVQINCRGEAVVLLLFYHLFDLLLCALLRDAERRLSTHLAPDRFDTGMRIVKQEKHETLIRVETGEVVAGDCRIVEGSAICSLALLDPSAGEFEAEENDFLFAGTLLVSGSFTAALLKEPRLCTPGRILRKTERFMQSEPRDCARVARATPYVQSVFVLLLLLFVLFPASAKAGLLLCFLTLFCCTDIYLRFRRAQCYYAYDALTRHGIYPESMQVIRRLPFVLALSRVLGLNEEGLRVSAPRAKKIFHLQRKLPHKKLYVLEYGSEHSDFIPAADLVLLYRDKRELAPIATRAFEVRVLCALLLLLNLLFFGASYLLLSLSGDLHYALLAVFGVFLFSTAIMLKSVFPNMFKFKK